jgi:hypothetical protein
VADHITHDPAYQTVAPDNFEAMLDVDRYGSRSDAFDAIIAATNDHFWNPNEPAYLDFKQPFNLREQTIIPASQVPEMNCAVADKLDAQQKIDFVNEVARFNLSGILHGEQGAASLSASLMDILHDPGAQEYASNQAREESRHVAAFTNYIVARWGKPLPAGPRLASLMKELVSAPEVYKKLVGMQMLLEGLAMGAFASMHATAQDPLLRRLVQFVMTDEAFHHKFGRIWAERTVPKLSEKEHEIVEDWAAQCFEDLIHNLLNTRQKAIIYPKFGLDWEWVRGAIHEALGDRDTHRRKQMRESTNMFRVLVKTLLQAGIITDRTKPLYAFWVDMKELEGENHEVAGMDIAEDGIAYLKEINAGRKKTSKLLRSVAR